MYTSTHTGSSKEESLSIYEYLGRAAGPTLGAAVYAEAVRVNVPISTQEVSTAKYTGKVCKYPVSFLIEYFKQTKEKQLITG